MEKPDTLATKNDDIKKQSTNYQSRINRWHDKQIEFTTITINLIFTITIGLIGFLIGQKDDTFKNDDIHGHSLFRVSLFILGISSTIGVILLIVRIYSFKFTKEILEARKNKKSSKYSEDKSRLSTKLEIAINTSKRWDKMIRPLLFLQVFLLLLTVWLLIIFV